jgi:hypothetical protein
MSTDHDIYSRSVSCLVTRLFCSELHGRPIESYFSVMYIYIINIDCGRGNIANKKC